MARACLGNFTCVGHPICTFCDVCTCVAAQWSCACLDACLDSCFFTCVSPYTYDDLGTSAPSSCTCIGIFACEAHAS
jgi:hypothetical protein